MCTGYQLPHLLPSGRSFRRLWAPGQAAGPKCVQSWELDDMIQSTSCPWRYKSAKNKSTNITAYDLLYHLLWVYHGLSNWIYLYKKKCNTDNTVILKSPAFNCHDNQRFPTRPREPWDLAPSTLGTCARAGVGVASTLSAWARAARSVSYSSHWVSVGLLWFDEIWHEK